MPNYSRFKLYASGNETSLNEFEKVMLAKYSHISDLATCDGPAHFFRLEEVEAIHENKNLAIFKGLCAWSAEHSFMPEGEYRKYPNNAQGKATNLVKESQRLNLQISLEAIDEVQTFQEYFSIVDGEIVEEWVEDLASVPNIEDFC